MVFVQYQLEILNDPECLYVYNLRMFTSTVHLSRSSSYYDIIEAHCYGFRYIVINGLSICVANNDCNGTTF